MPDVAATKTGDTCRGRDRFGSPRTISARSPASSSSRRPRSRSRVEPSPASAESPATRMRPSASARRSTGRRTEPRLVASPAPVG